MNTVLELYFISQLGEEEKMTVRNPKPDLTAVEIKSVMEDMIAADIFVTPSGAIASPSRARYVNRTTQDVEF